LSRGPANQQPAPSHHWPLPPYMAAAWPAARGRRPPRITR